MDCAWDKAPTLKRIGSVETLKFIVYGFRWRDEKEKARIISPTLQAHGQKWRITLDLGDTVDPESNVGCFVTYLGTRDLTIWYTIRCQDREMTSVNTFTSKKSGRGYKNFLKRSNMFTYVEHNDSLIIEVDIQLTAVAGNRQLYWFPPKAEPGGILCDLYQNASSETADVIFSVRNNEYKAHKSILGLRCKKLFEIAKEYGPHQSIPIHSTSADVFKSILDFAYTMKLPNVKNKDIATQLLVAADIYDAVELKLYVESIIVYNFLTPQTAAELLLFADSHSCALLKEEATTLFVTDAAAVKNSKAWPQIKESPKLVVELLDTTMPASKEYKDDDLTAAFDQMNIIAIREELELFNLELDGSREIIVERLKIYHGRKNKGKTKEDDVIDDGDDGDDDDDGDNDDNPEE